MSGSSTELTKRKAFAFALDGDGVATASSSSTNSGLQSPHSGGHHSRQLLAELDVRPSCAADAPRRYVRTGERLALASASASPAADTHSVRARLAGCVSLRGITRELKEMFLPAGYPDSVSEDYLAFQCWDTLQAVCSYLRGVLATQSVLQSVGVGNDKATPLAAALQWVLRDGSGMIGGLTFAYFVGPKFDVNVKRWRLFADVINDVGLTLDMLAPFFPSLVTEVLCVSSVCKTMCGVAAGATRSSLMTHFAKRDNMADCAAKEGSQETAVKLFGLVFGMYFANAVNSSPAAIWVAFLTLTLVHVFANYNAVSGLCIPTVNQQRGLILIQRFLRAGSTKDSDVVEHLTQFSIRSVNQSEPIYYDSKLPISRIIMGSQVCDANLSVHDWDFLLQLYSDEHYLLSIDNDRVHVLFRTDMKPKDELRAFYQAVVALEALETQAASAVSASPSPSPTSKAKAAAAASGGQHRALLESSYDKMSADFSFFHQQLQTSGWRTHMFLLNTSTWRIRLSEDV
ncbi:hypothetical protein PybrP1_001095 [[Pythium] brassicae (nom. inval.)]|nr:hypothetical protein PybrP1_001095 [[Pythium] brassicae (nom. inval.)]